MKSKRKEIFEILKETALQDNVMNLEEVNIISHAMRTAIGFDTYLSSALSDGFLSQDEKLQLTKLKERIYNEAYKIAERDDKISENEAKLLKKLSEYLENSDEFQIEKD
jgi:hypothetical protein